MEKMMDRGQLVSYFSRIGLAYERYENRELDGTLLQELHTAHIMTIPFENLDILRGIPLSLRPEDLFEKVVRRRRGGNCFELNGLSGWFLRSLGYGVKDYFSRYFRDAQGPIPMRRHRLLRVEALDGTYFWDIGIGQNAPRLPLRLIEGVVQKQGGEQYRFAKEPFFGWVLYEFHKGEWQRMLSFTEEAQADVDYITACVWCELAPQSPFNKQEIVAIRTADGRKTVDGRTFRCFCGAEVTVRENLTDRERQAVLSEHFGLAD